MDTFPSREAYAQHTFTTLITDEDRADVLAEYGVDAMTPEVLSALADGMDARNNGTVTFIRIGDSALVVEDDAENDGYLSDGAARAVAALWQSPGTIGHILASLASGRTVNREALWLDIDTTIHHDNPQGDDRRALEALQRWADGAVSDLLTDED